MACLLSAASPADGGAAIMRKARDALPMRRTPELFRLTAWHWPAAQLALKPFVHVNPLSNWPCPWSAQWCWYAGRLFVSRQAFPSATWRRPERIIAALVWGRLALITDLAPTSIEAMEQVEFKIGQQHVHLRTTAWRGHDFPVPVLASASPVIMRRCVSKRWMAIERIVGVTKAVGRCSPS